MRVQTIRSDRELTDSYSPLFELAKTADKDTIEKYKSLNTFATTFVKRDIYDFLLTFGADEYDLSDDTENINGWAIDTLEGMSKRVAMHKPANKEGLAELKKVLMDAANDTNVTSMDIEKAERILAQVEKEQNLSYPFDMMYKPLYITYGKSIYTDPELIKEFTSFYLFESNMLTGNTFWTPTYAALQDGGNHVVNRIAEFVVDSIKEVE